MNLSEQWLDYTEQNTVQIISTVPQSLLIVDDEPHISRALKRLLRPDGYHIHDAKDPQEAMQLLRSTPVDVVMSDYRMPGQNGVEFLRQVCEEFPDTVRLMLSGQANMEAVIDAVNSGSIFKFLLKPWSNDAMREVISEAFEQRHQQLNLTDHESGWLTRSHFLKQEIDDYRCMLVGEWVNAAQCLNALDQLSRQQAFEQITQTILKTLPVAGEIGHVERATFACAVNDPLNETELTQLGKQLGRVLRTGGPEMHASFRFGFVDTQQPHLEDNLCQALVALDCAYRGGVTAYSDDLGQQVHRRRTLENDLFHAVAREQLFYELQPQISSQSEKIISAEALLRWQHPRLGLISPLHIIDMAEQNGLISDIGFWIARSVCRQLAQWQGTELANMRVSINLSPRQFLQGNVTAELRSLLLEYSVDPKLFEVEITESCIMENVDACIEQLKFLSDLGVRVALDDFGTGYSSLSQLNQLPLDVIKIDRAFVCDLDTENPDAHTLFHRMVDMSHSLGFATVVEGVETQRQFEVCRAAGCEVIQGYYFSKPLVPEKFVQFCSGQIDRGGS